MSKPLCFILMPFGIKKDRQSRNIDFDDVYNKIIRPAIIACDLEPIRADEETDGGTIHKPMFERLILCDYAIADLTTSNANVFYELGVRHALRPFTTIPISAFDGPLPFDLKMQRTLTYDLNKEGKLTNIKKNVETLISFLNASKNHHHDSPVFSLIDDFDVKHNLELSKTDSFRKQAIYNHETKEQLADIRRIEDKKERLKQLQAKHESLKPINDKEAGVVIDLFLTYRDIKEYELMLQCYDEMSKPLQQAKMVQEQLGFGLNRAGQGDKAIEVLEAIIKEHDNVPETNGILARVHKDLWQQANEKGEKLKARGHLKEAIKQYRLGFEADCRDAYPGINLVTLLAIKGEMDEFNKYLPVVRFAIDQKMKRQKPDYWDVITLVELAVLENNFDLAEDRLGDALSKNMEGWMAETTINNLRMLQSHIGDRIDVERLEDVIGELEKSSK